MRARFFERVDDSLRLKLCNGKKIASLHALYKALDSISDKEFKKHVNHKKNDLYQWVKDVIKNNELANDLLECDTKEAVMFCLKTAFNIPKKKIEPYPDYKPRLQRLELEIEKEKGQKQKKERKQKIIKLKKVEDIASEEKRKAKKVKKIKLKIESKEANALNSNEIIEELKQVYNVNNNRNYFN